MSGVCVRACEWPVSECLEAGEQTARQAGHYNAVGLQGLFISRFRHATLCHRSQVRFQHQVMRLDVLGVLAGLCKGRVGEEEEGGSLTTSPFARCLKWIAKACVLGSCTTPSPTLPCPGGLYGGSF